LKLNRFKNSNCYGAFAIPSSITIQSIFKGIEMLPKKPTYINCSWWGSFKFKFDQ